ncbi:murein DD-endopeptidase MepM/ murein hydrolase activator NlpD [Curtobacterium flaccumfaciens]|uniref:Murein DD-endopeptidase MepM/ murein hydrolase activator NlpD n=1 Tax=Curtobacterium salicis TaxID=1779862 RepID=A0ABX0T949_9MICO|nr:M23 family metallopeptidase [Curtobacterium sp. WW7]NII42026.1 murein DD-endopeptidase MepM/ murein hydrolase activator NlpD [Curtobacterium sp. WW7]
MLDSSQTPTTIDRTAPEATPSVHLTRRARIEAERSAAKTSRRRSTTDRSVASPDRSAARPATAGPATPPAPSSPVLPASSAAPLTPPAPSSPIVAPLAERTSAAAAPAAARPASSRRAPSAKRAARVAAPKPMRSGAVPTVPAIADGPRVDRATRHIARTAPAAGRGSRKSGASFRRTASGVTVVGALLFTAGLVVSTSLPAQALYVPQPGAATVRASVQAAQSLSVGDAVEGSVDRDAYTVSEPKPVVVAPTVGMATDSSTFTNDADGTIQWPFPVGVPISSGFGGRQVAGCSFCSTFHQGVDFAPGAGTAIGAVADGTVIKVQADDGGFGNDVWIQHDVDGKQFVSVYGHMLDNSFQVVQGQQVKVGQTLGLVGSTGNSTGPHLHLEIRIDGVPVDPLAWLEANAN